MALQIVFARQAALRRQELPEEERTEVGKRRAKKQHKKNHKRMKLG